MELQMAEAEVNFLSLEVDFDYEFDASRYFDFVREETPSEAWEAEFWFETAGSYPPSPFISKMVLEKNIFAGTVNTLPKSKDTEMPSFRLDRAGGRDLYDLDEISNVFTVQNCVLHDPCQNEKRFVFGSSARVSTLMKPTASHLAKHNNHRQVRYAHQSAHRLQKPLVEECVKNSEDPSENGVQAAKRQKLEGGILRKVVTEKQQIDLMHKIPVNNNKTSTCKLRLTIPREPVLETAQRSRRIRAQRSNVNKLSQEEKTPVTTTFKSHPLNRKITEAPSTPSCLKSTPTLPEIQNFKLKTSERDFKHSAATSSSLVVNNHIAGRYCEQSVKSHLKCFQRQPSIASKSVSVDQRIHNDENIRPKFKARPLNKKILSSKGDIGVFRCAKQEATKPMEFNLSTNKRSQQDLPQDLPTELFNKLSINSDGSHCSESLTSPLWPSHGSRKVLKGNVKYIAQQGHKASSENQGNLLKNEAKLFGFENEDCSYPRLEANNMRRHVIR
ncbi:protein TPX2 isoform X2 [Dendrobium catenatum]|uniref:Protein TPX2 n=1 Tax=Dendrobium catenatum TaxID=906689 RepID=A0A2I0WBA4_9ASPA|nr:protein TPX2 isoform X2 [Dendrobium catenatum]PKU72939.1 Protein TPX2 [Dendrobium catenatum]